MADISSRQQRLEVGVDFFGEHRPATYLYECSSHLFLGLLSGPTSEFDSAIIESLRTQAQRFSLWGISFDAHTGGLNERVHKLDSLKQALLPLLGTLAKKLVLLARQPDREQELAGPINLTQMIPEFVPRTSTEDEVESAIMPISSLDDLSSSDSSDSNISHPSESLEPIADIKSYNDCLFGLGGVLEDCAESVPRNSRDSIGEALQHSESNYTPAYDGERNQSGAPLMSRGFPMRWLDSTSTSSTSNQSRSNHSRMSRSTATSNSTNRSSSLDMSRQPSSSSSGPIRPVLPLYRRMESQHATGRTRKVWVCKDRSPDRKFLANCKACTEGKKYGAFYNAVAHLRRVHFHAKQKGHRSQGISKIKSRGGQEEADPPIEILRLWITEIKEIMPLDESVLRIHGDDEEMGNQSNNSETTDLLIADPVDQSTSFDAASANKIFSQFSGMDAWNASDFPRTGMPFTIDTNASANAAFP